jgi:hypothetical protein
MPQLNDIKMFNKGMNKDVDPRFLGDGEYIDALNVINSNYLDGASNAVTNFPSIQRLSTLGYTILGLFKDEHEDKLYIFASNGTTGAIYSYTVQTDALATVLSTTALPWTTSTIIKAANITENIIVWTDGDNEIGMYDQNVSYGTITSDMLTLAQVTPLTKPSLTLLSDTNYKSNNITGKFFQFKYRFVFKNKMRSTFSPISNVAYSSDDYFSPTYMSGRDGLVNAIDIIMSGANSNGLVDQIEIAARSGNNGDFFLVKTVDADGTFLGGSTQTYRFYNEGLYNPIDIQESNQLFNDVPKLAQTLEFASNRVIVGDCTNGYDDIDVDYDIDVIYRDGVAPETQRVDTDTITPANTRYGFNNASEFSTFMTAQFKSAPTPGDQVTCAGKSVTGGGVPTDYINPFGAASVHAEFGDTWSTVWTKLTAIEFYVAAIGEYMSLHDISTNNIPPDTQPTGNDAFIITLTEGAHSKTFKTGAWYLIGLQYEDKYGRTNGVQVQDDNKVYIQTIGERGLTPNDYTNAGHAEIQVTINNAMPSWAETVKVVYSRASVYDQSFQVATRGAHVSTHVWIDIGSIEEWNDVKGGNLAYQWEKGDRIRVLTEHHATYPLTNWATQLWEAEIVADDSTGGLVTGGYAIAIPAFDGLTPTETASMLTTSIIEVFRPSKQLEASEAIYTEASYLEGSSDVITGDAYLKSRDDWPYGLGVYGTNLANIAFEGYDISDFIESEHYDKGRATAVINQDETRRRATLMYSEVIIPNTDINNLNRFFPDVNYEEYNKSFGNIIHLHNEGDHLLMLQEDKVSKVYVDRSLMYDGSGNATVLNTQDRVLSEAVPYAGVYGIQDHRSFQSIGNRRYWVDMARGVVIRLSTNGIEEISRYGMRGWFSDMCRTRLEAGETVSYGAYDIQNDLYMLYFGTGNTVVFDEKNNAWVTFTDIIVPAFSTYLNNRSFIIYTNYLWEMNYSGSRNLQRVTGVETAKTSTIKFSSNMEPVTLKNYLGIKLDSTYAMSVAIETDAINGGTNQQSSLVVGDFTQREQEWHASFLRDANTPNVTYPLISGDTMKGKHAEIELSLQTDEDLLIRTVQVLVSKG